MRRLLAYVAVLVALAAPLGLPAKAEAHKSGCGHGLIYWTVWSYGQAIQYRESYKYDYTSGGVHWHVYRTSYAPYDGDPPWAMIHDHHRACGALHS